MEYKVKFGSFLLSDKFGFIRKGTITITGKSITYEGRRVWSITARLLVFIILTFIPFIILGLGFGFLPAVIIIILFCNTEDSITIDGSSISNFKRKGRLITFKANHPEKSGKRKSVFKIKTLEKAKEFETTILSSSLNT